MIQHWIRNFRLLFLARIDGIVAKGEAKSFSDLINLEIFVFVVGVALG